MSNAAQNPLILVVDDREINRDSLTEMLESEYNIIIAKDGAEEIRRASCRERVSHQV